MMEKCGCLQAWYFGISSIKSPRDAKKALAYHCHLTQLCSSSFIIFIHLCSAFFVLTNDNCPCEARFASALCKILLHIFGDNS